MLDSHPDARADLILTAGEEVNLAERNYRMCSRQLLARSVVSRGHADFRCWGHKRHHRWTAPLAVDILRDSN